MPSSLSAGAGPACAWVARTAAVRRSIENAETSQDLGLSWPILVFLAGLTICTTLEYVAAAGLERLFGLVLWDYQDKPLNVHGRICLQSALMWGLLSLLLIYVLDPMLGRMISAIPRPAGDIALVVLVLLTVISTLLTVASFYRLGRRASAPDLTREPETVGAGEPWGDRLIGRLAPDPVLFRTFSHANLILRYQAARASSGEHT
ncbi:MAG TPA: putative ABC transporter permease [Candidatus Lumbricidophila sp.]|nr:putative ABC transporter permease [Candidatus Lumbricidophila sp.]